MRRETLERIRAREAEGLTVDQRLARARDSAPEDHPVYWPTLPPAASVPLITCTLAELHDLVYAASSSYLHSLSSMGQDKARLHAARIAAQAEVVARGTDYLHQGDDPRG